jgi:hypothetical protein
VSSFEQTVERLRREGRPLRKIAAETGLPYSRVRKILAPNLVRAEYERSNRRRSAAKREWENEHERSPCPECGKPMGVGSHRRGSQRCDVCRRECEAEHILERDKRIAALWAAGLLMRQIADEFGWTITHLGAEMTYIRRRGNVELPHRYRLRTPA